MSGGNDAAARVALALALALAKDRLAAGLGDAAAVPGATFFVGSVP
jgi:hypothetical protein